MQEVVVLALPMDRVYPNPEQPRTIFDAGKLSELAASIKEHGLLQPIQVRPDADGGFMIVMGERRWRAHQLLNLPTINATVCELSDDDLADRSFVENWQRANVSPLEEAKWFERRLRTGIGVEDLAKRLGIKQPYRIAERLELLKLEPEFQDALAKRILNPSQALAMSRLSASGQRTLFEAIRAGRCRTNAELRSVADAMLDAEKQTSMFGEVAGPTEAEREVVSRFEKTIGSVTRILRGGFADNDVVILRKVNPLRASVLGDELQLIEQEMKKLRLVLRAAAVVGPTAPSAAEVAAQVEAVKTSMAKVVDYSAAARKAWETRRRNAALKNTGS